MVHYIFQIHGPYSQFNPVNGLPIFGCGPCYRAALMIKGPPFQNRSGSVYKDWLIVGLAIALGITGMVTQIGKGFGGAGWPYLSSYFPISICLWSLSVSGPFSRCGPIWFTGTVGYGILRNIRERQGYFLLIRWLIFADQITNKGEAKFCLPLFWVPGVWP